jgi:tetratricopeptide (TPR) repeat protein
MKFVLKCLTLSSVAIHVLGCANFSQTEMALSGENRQVEKLAGLPWVSQLAQASDASEETYKLGRQSLVKGDVEIAMAQFKSALKMNPQSLDARNGIAVALFELGRFEEALSAIAIAKKLEPSDPLVLRNEGRILSALNNATVLEKQVTLVQQPVSKEVEKTSSIQLTSPGVYTLTLAAAPELTLSPKQAKDKLPEPVRKDEPSNLAITDKKIIVAKPATRINIELLVANGAGKAGLACAQVRLLRASRTIGSADVHATCADYRDYKQLQTVLYVKKGLAIDTAALRLVLGASKSFKVMQATNLPGTATAQLVIGRDWIASNVRNTTTKQRV